MIQLSVAQIIAQRHTRRWHTRSVSRQQSVAEHAHQVALLALHLAPEDLSDQECLVILLLALLHDAHEPEFGDIPYPAKRAMEVRGLDVDAWCRRSFWGEDDPHDHTSPRARALVEAADQLEAALYAKEHLAPLASVIRDQTMASLVEMSLLPPESYCKALDAMGVRA